jgi:hypothetical protein
MKLQLNTYAVMIPTDNSCIELQIHATNQSTELCEK